MAASVGSRFLTPWVGDQNPPPSPLASNPVIFRRYSTGIELLEQKKDRRSSVIDPGHGRGVDDLEDHDTTSLADFLKNHEPPSSSYMSVPFAHADEKDRESKWSKFMAMKRRSKSVPRPPQNIQLPDSAVSGVTIGGHRHIAISIPLEAMPFASDSTTQTSANMNNNVGTRAGGTRNEYATLPRNFAVQTYSGENGTVTVFPAATDEVPALPQAPSTQRSSLLSQQSISSSLEERSSHTQSTTGSHHKSSSQSTGYSTEGSMGPSARNQAKNKPPGYVSIFPKITDPPHINAQGMVVWGPQKSPTRPNSQQRPARPSSMVVPAGPRHRHPAHSASIDGLLSVAKEVETVRDGYNKKPLPKPPGKGDSRVKQLYKPGIGFPSPITEETTDGSSRSTKRSVRRAVSAQSMLTVNKELPSRPSTAGSIQTRREKVRDKKRRDMEAARALKELQRRKSEDERKEHEDGEQSRDNADAHEEIERPQASSLNTLIPIVVVVDLQPSPGLPEDKSGQKVSSPPSSSHSSSPDMSQLRLSRDMDSELYLQHKRNLMDKQILRLYDSYHENRLRDVERRIRRLERNGDVWLRALVPVLDDMSRNIKTSSRISKAAHADGEGRGWASDDEVSSAGAERKARSAKRTKTSTRRASLSRDRIVAGLIGGKLASDDSESSDTMSRGDEVSGLGIIEPLMRELAGEARRRQEQIAERTADDWPMSSTPWIFICPSSRGIGNALTRHILRRTARLPTPIPVLATTRHPDPAVAKAALLRDVISTPSSFYSSSSSLNGQHEKQQQDELSKRLFVVRCDVTDESTIASAAQEARNLFPKDSHHLHLACVLPGVLLNPEKSPAQVDADAALQSFRVNAVGQLLVAKHFFGFLPRKATAMAPPGYEYDDEDMDEEDDYEGEDEDEAEEEAALRLPQHATWLNMSARVGSTTDNRAGGWFSYRASKAAVNSITKSLDIQLRTRAGDNAMAVAYHPGTVKTDLSKDYWGGVPEEKLFSTEYAAERLMDVVCGLGVKDRGRCWDWKGTEIPP
ncbi:hypothetical protein J3F84DRAFT_397337 [Trichoderma pleuroticola]